MNALSKYVFAPDAFGGSNELYNYLQQQRRGFGFFAAGEDPKIHQRVIVAQVRVLGHLLHPNTLNRISDSELYGNKYGLSEMMTDLNNAIFKADIAGSVNGFRQNLQVAYTKQLIAMVVGPKSKKHMPASRSMAVYNLKQIKKLASISSGNTASKAHKAHLVLLIDNALKEIK